MKWKKIVSQGDMDMGLMGRRRMMRLREMGIYIIMGLGYITTMSSTFKKSDYIGFIDKIAESLKNGVKYKEKSYNPETGIFDILVHKNQLNDFVKGGKHYKAFKKLVKYSAIYEVQVATKIRVLK